MKAQKNIISILVFFIGIALWGCSEKTETIKQTSMDEKHRLKVHFSPESKWINDPNGMVYYEGEYHLFFQHYPDSTVWGPMHWGHAVSRDLIHWQQLPIAIYPDSLGWIFSGSAVIDWQNTSGLGTENKPAMIAIYTYHNTTLEKQGRNDFQYQGLAYSLDKGRTWQKYEKNPVLPNPGIRDFRDPKVFWSDEFRQWYMILAVQDHTEIYSSKNLLSWQKESEFGKTMGAHGGVWECPDLFPMNADGKNYWVMLVSIGSGGPNGGSATQYFVGNFDGKTFSTTQKNTKWIDYGKDDYAGVTWNNAPENKRLFMGWLNNWQYAQEIPTESWRGAMTLPRELELVNIKGDLLLKSHLSKHFDILKEKAETIKPQQINQIKEISSIQLPIELALSFDAAKSSATKFGIVLSNGKGDSVKIGFDKTRNAFFVDNTANGWESSKKEFAKVSYAPNLGTKNTVSLRLIIDQSAVELYAADDLVVMTNQFFPTEPFSAVSLFSENGKVVLEKGEMRQLKNSWIAN